MNVPARAVVPGAALALLLALVSCSGGSQDADAGATPATTTTQGADDAVGLDPAEADVEFAQMMIVHHRDALESGVDPQVLALAQQIAVFQMQEIEQMRALLAS